MTSAWTRPALFWAEAVPAAGEVVLDGPEGRHAADVRRVRPGEVVLLGDGAGTRARAEVTDVARGRVVTRVLERRSEPAPALRIVLAQALVKGDRGELAVELATEAGVDAVLPWRAERCVARWDDGPRGEKALARWRATAREAAKQARRARLPEVAPPVTTRDLAARGDAVLLLEATAEHSLATVPLPDEGDLVLVVGPEGGVTDDERAQLVDAGAREVRMGRDVLRTSTAAAVALGALGARTARWG
ncbi:16S rRNA (uracil(1498)-N(3))-methyltransferase [Actinomycetospora cinnamomea]|uniref:Ribosomal RNA small subunit methyltransferase E n=1 Tax=Actinomycetospora cinnamomea TaxID=663609 RepID=A0A2U1F0Q9_9PSEU|nr:16S rRNA (uracil(1498)-N(3))-methyltransferase [Actinomycetospora cinnamomea]PVZ05774.1 16S rRNA (uracil1498-N3)-methyltransferase [Actinomycetospora cinnamomea]